MQQLESDLDQTQEKLMTANQRLEEKEKALQNAEGNFFQKNFLNEENVFLNHTGNPISALVLFQKALLGKKCLFLKVEKI